MNARFSTAARLQLLAAGEYIRRDNPAAARRFAARVGAALRQLRRFPHSGRRVPEFPGSGYREVIVAPYRIFYRVGTRDVLVVAVVHGARLPDQTGE